MSELVRLNKLLAEQTGIARRKADQAISEGRVLINGRVALLGERINPSTTQIVFDGNVISLDKPSLSFAFNKPRGYVTSLKLSRERGRSVSELLPLELGLKPAGRLDTESEGLLIVSNDGNLINLITHPRFEIEKEYLVWTDRRVTDGALRTLVRGVELDDGWCKPDWVGRDSEMMRIVIHEGRNREIRRLFAAIGYRVKRLIRIRIAQVLLNELESGALRRLNREEENSLRGLS